jgi:tetratricopeptide (TPR) repeat protein
VALARQSRQRPAVRGRSEEATARYQAALAIEPGAFEAHHNLGLALQQDRPVRRRTGRRSARRSDCVRMPRKRTSSSACACTDSVAWTKRYPSSGKPIRLRPDYAQARLNLAPALDNRALGGSPSMSSVKRSGPGPRTADAHFRFANALMRAKRPDEAVTEYRHGGRHRTRHHGVSLPILGFALEQLGRLDEALEQYPGCAAAGPNSGGDRETAWSPC